LTSISMTRMAPDHADTSLLPAPPHIVVQILGLLLFGGFAIVTTVLAFVAFWPAGFVLAIILAKYGFGPIQNQRYAKRTASLVNSAVVPPQTGSSGNTNFDAYRAEVLKRLEDEQKTFVSFLDRLRDAKDKSEFDTFMDDRARVNATTVPVIPPADGTARTGNY
jgi:hypothetical protein